MKERPILFSGPMVRALLYGRKTQTRRMVKPQPTPDRYFADEKLEWNPGKLHYTECNVNWRPLSRAFIDYIQNGHCPYGGVGDRLWVRETWRMDRYNIAAEYRATTSALMEFIAPWRPSIHMPRWASRITLEITAVRVERLTDISNEDCWNEGMSDETNPELKANRKWFSELWESIHGPGSWDSNPWVWVIQFRWLNVLNK